MNTENCWFCNDDLGAYVVTWNGHLIHKSCNKPNEFLVISPITRQRLERYVAMDLVEGIGSNAQTSDIDEMFVRYTLDELIERNVFILGVGETSELDNYYGVSLPANAVKTTTSVIYDVGDGWYLVTDVVAFMNPENGQHYIHSDILF